METILTKINRKMLVNGEELTGEQIAQKYMGKNVVISINKEINEQNIESRRQGINSLYRNSINNNLEYFVDKDGFSKG